MCRIRFNLHAILAKTQSSFLNTRLIVAIVTAFLLILSTVSPVAADPYYVAFGMSASPLSLQQNGTITLTISETPMGSLSVSHVSAAFGISSAIYKVISYDYTGSPFSVTNKAGVYPGVWSYGMTEQPYCLVVDRQSPTAVSGTAVIAKIVLQVLVSGLVANTMMSNTCSGFQQAWDQNSNLVTTDTTNAGFNLNVSPVEPSPPAKLNPISKPVPDSKPTKSSETPIGITNSDTQANNQSRNSGSKSSNVDTAESLTVNTKNAASLKQTRTNKIFMLITATLILLSLALIAWLRTGFIRRLLRRFQAHFLRSMHAVFRYLSHDV